ncbi:MAG: hypothetical protein HGA31_05830 [Candidatus Moranbacteria bacterium]|nr:hypothetical protein [Candidatus Moranbacteria bacterium]
MKGIPPLAKLFLLIFVVGTGFALYSGWQELQRSKRIEDEVSRLQREAQQVRDENLAISERIDFFSTTTSEERVAKEKLGMKYKDEQVLSVELDPTVVSGGDFAQLETVTDKERPNYRRWLAYFNIIR